MPEIRFSRDNFVLLFVFGIAGLAMLYEVIKPYLWVVGIMILVLFGIGVVVLLKKFDII